MLWVRLVAIIAFIIFVIVKQMTLIAVLGGVLLVVTLFQMRTAYRSRRVLEAQGDDGGATTARSTS